ncbi:hypothetical protein GALMADRAFT_158647 [Galerina marginata CBS 339.88]|uniref:Uncharacterized protein n=1 Tax=Galerina marginata (strain CBS 339.88) TaxID=685588 RepID=A0A067T1Z3_GALM3|nr:hypothetical protein GALMADRAFT_158647 [Galerina marginata CBS 339.88]
MPPLTRKKQFQAAKLVVSIDIGTTYTAASYCVLANNTEPQFQEVNVWPNQVFPDAKIPSSLYYDEHGVARLHGAETEDETLLLEAEIGNWTKAEWWKLLLRPEYLPAPIGFTPCNLPPQVTVDQAFRDQFAYVFKTVRAFIVKRYGKGEDLWSELSASMFVVLTAPNGWEGRHQNRMRQAAVQAGLVSPDNRNRVQFVSEGEAAIHYCLDSVTAHSVSAGSTVLVCDAGGGTTDIGIYRVKNTSPISLEEISRPRCFLAGGVFVNALAMKFIKGRLRGSKWDTDSYLASAMRTFERQAKRGFKGVETAVFIQLDGSSDTDDVRGIARGRLKITRHAHTLLIGEMVKFFEPSTKLVTDGLEEVLSECGWSIDQIFVVGGFAESEYVFTEIKKLANSNNIPVGKPDGVLSKAIAHGALSWYINSGVQVRIARLHYGAETNIEFKSADKSMTGRAKFQNVLGQWRVRGAWNAIVEKNSKLRATSSDERCAWFHHEFGENEDLELEMELYAYRWEKPPVFLKEKGGNLSDGFIHLGTVKGDLTRCFNAMTFKTSPSGKRYKTLQYEVCLSFQDIEIQARLRWQENRRFVYGSATIVYDL